MFSIDNVYLSDEIALARFACNLSACGGMCCVRGDAGAPVKRAEIPVLNKAWNLLKNGLSDKARRTVAEKGLLWGNDMEPELATCDGAECVFVEYDKYGTALCSIQRAYHDGLLNWPKPLSCHLYPLRIFEAGSYDYVNFEYIPEMCSPACDHARDNDIYLAEFLEEPLTRKYGPAWFKSFITQCKRIRAEKRVTAC